MNDTLLDTPPRPIHEKIASDGVRVVSWNVNGIRAAHKKGFLDVLSASNADAFCLQETRAHLDQLAPELTSVPGYRVDLAEAERKGYSGVGTYTRASHVTTTKAGLGIKKFDAEGRCLVTDMGRLRVVNLYVPNGSGKDRDQSRVPYKLAFSRAVYKMLNAAKRAGQPILVLGDMNTAHKEIDLARPKQNAKTSGFLDEEREELDRWIRNGWTDTFRAFDREPHRYTWWSQRFGVREKNVGWRIDYILASPGAEMYLQDAFIWSGVLGSDHCPLGVELAAEVLSA